MITEDRTNATYHGKDRCYAVLMHDGLNHAMSETYCVINLLYDDPSVSIYAEHFEVEFDDPELNKP